jgi:hypothetical protein
VTEVGSTSAGCVYSSNEYSLKACSSASIQQLIGRPVSLSMLHRSTSAYEEIEGTGCSETRAMRRKVGALIIWVMGPSQIIDGRHQTPSACSALCRASHLSPLSECIADGLTEYPAALAEMQARVAAIRAGTASEMVWLVEYPPLYTAGTSARPGKLTDPTRFPSFNAGRGGQWTYRRTCCWGCGR